MLLSGVELSKTHVPTVVGSEEQHGFHLHNTNNVIIYFVIIPVSNCAYMLWLIMYKVITYTK